MVLQANPRCELGIRLRLTGVPLGEVFSFISGLYFRGKLAYATAFSESPTPASSSVYIITSSNGLIAPETLTSPDQLQEMADVPIHASNPRYTLPLERDITRLAAEIDQFDKVVLLGSVATPKYVDPLWNILGDRLMIPAAFIGLGDMARGSLMLRAVREGKQLAYVGAKPASREAGSSRCSGSRAGARAKQESRRTHRRETRMPACRKMTASFLLPSTFTQFAGESWGTAGTVHY